MIAPLVSSFEAQVELLVVDGTDQGQRQAGKIARVYLPGTQRILAELFFPRLVRFKGPDFILTGIERFLDEYQRVTGFAQAWVCQLAPPLNGWESHVGEMYFYGQVVPRTRLRDKHGGCHAGYVEIGDEFIPALGRLSQVATFTTSVGGRMSRLLDAELTWMAEESFALAGTHLVAATAQKPETAYQGGWLCSYSPVAILEKSDK